MHMDISFHARQLFPMCIDVMSVFPMQKTADTLQILAQKKNGVV